MDKDLPHLDTSDLDILQFSTFQTCSLGSINIPHLKNLQVNFLGEYALPKPVVLSPHGQLRVQEDLGVNVTNVGEDAYMVSPQHWSKYRPLGQVEEMYLRDMEGQTVSHSDNPGIRVEPSFVSETEEDQIMAELIDLASTFGCLVAKQRVGTVSAFDHGAVIIFDHSFIKYLKAQDGQIIEYIYTFFFFLWAQVAKVITIFYINMISTWFNIFFQHLSSIQTW